MTDLFICIHPRILKHVAIIASWLLVACSREAEPAAADNAGQLAPPVAAIAAPAQAAPSLVAPAGLAVPDITVNALMKDTIDPAARELWTAVSYVVSAAGTQETAPETDADWDALRGKANVLMQAAVTLQLPGLRIHADAEAPRPEFQFSPQQIAAAVASNPRPWRGFAQDMQQSALQILGAIARRDLVEYSTTGVILNESCEGCHAEYWYKPQAMPGAEGVR
jgi:hypothetical protein